MPAYADCPHCFRYVRVNNDGNMRVHRMDTGYLMKGTLFPYCPYGGCTLEEARRKYTYILKRRDEFEKRGGIEAAKKRFLRRRERIEKLHPNSQSDR